MEDAPRPQRPGNPNRNPKQNPSNRRKTRRWYFNKKEKITMITLGSVALVLIIAAIILFSSMNNIEDDGLIFKGVMAAGVDLGGMTPEEAMDALAEATADTYTKLDMTVTVLDTQISLSPQRTGARLDVAAVVEAAYDYGRTGSRSEQSQARKDALVNSVIIPITPYLNLDTDYIRTEIDKLGGQFSSTLTQPTLTLTGTKPETSEAKPDTSKVHQTLSIYVGTAEYGLDTNKLYEQVLEYYNINIFQVIGTCTVVAPDSFEEELLTYYEQLCEEPVDAQIDSVTYEVTPEVYGYGFNLDAVKEQLAKAPYGSTVDIELKYLTPNLTEELISGNLFKADIGEYSAPLGIDSAWNDNVAIACKKLNNVILKSGESFSFNELLGKPTKKNGYSEAGVYIGKKLEKVMGGGVTHVASVLYNCVLQAELEVLEKHNHTYAVNFIETGRDVFVNYGSADFRFRNSRPDPIRIKATVEDGNIQISIEGTESRDYTVDIEIVVKRTIRPGKLYNTMLSDNSGGYTDNQELVAPLNGYEIEIYKYLYDKDSYSLQNKTFLTTCKYEARDAVVVKLQDSATTPTVPGTDTSTPSTQPGAGTTPSESTPATQPNTSPAA